MRRVPLALTLALIGAASSARAQTPNAGGPPAAAQAKLGEELTLLADGPGKGFQEAPTVAFGKDAYLVVWTEGAPVEGGRARLMATRLSTEGKILDPRAIEVAPNAAADGPQTWPRVAFCQGIFLVVWQDFRNGRDYDVLGARISSEGKVLDATPIPVGAGPGTQALPDVATDGNGFLVAYQRHPDQGQARYRSVVATVGIEGGRGEPLEVLDQPHPRLAWDGASYLVVGGGVHSAFAGTVAACLLGPDGKPKAKPFKFGGAGHAPLLALAAQPGKGWHVTKHRNYPDFWGWGGPPAQMGYFITSDGKLAPDFPKEDGYPKANILQPGWLDVLDTTAKTAPYGPSASAWDGKHFVVVWQRFQKPPPRGFYCPLTNCDLLIGRVDGWRPLDGRGQFVANSPAEEQWPALACEGPGRFLCAYTKSEPDGSVRITARLVQIPD